MIQQKTEEKKYYLLENVKVVILEKATEQLNKKGYVIIQGLECGSTMMVNKSRLRKGGLLKDYFNNKN